MALFFQVLGAVCFTAVVLLGLILAGLFIARSRLRSALQGLHDMAPPQPARVHLSPASELVWADAEAATTSLDALRAAGFQEIGPFGLDEIPAIKLYALFQPEERVWGVVYEHPEAGVWVDLVSRYEDGTSLTYANTGEGAGLDQRPGHGIIRAPGLEVAALYRRHLAERPARTLKPVSANAFTQSFESAYAEEMDWRNSRGGPTTEELRAVLEARGSQVSDEAIEETRRLLADQAAEGLSEAILERFLATTTLPAAEWEKARDRVVVVHENMSPSLLVEAFMQELEYDDEHDAELPASDDLEREAEGGEPRQLFARWNDGLPAGFRYRLLGSVQEPVPGDIWAFMPE